MTDPWLVLKFGGTSVSGKQQWMTIASLARQRLEKGNRVLLVCSAVAGVTDALQSLAENPGDHDSGALESLLTRHRRLADELEIEVEDLLQEAREKSSHILGLLAGGRDLSVRFSATASLLSMGEWLSTR